MSTEVLVRPEQQQNLRLQQEQDLFAARLYNSGEYRSPEVAAYVATQEKTHIAEGMEMQQVSVRTLPFRGGHVRGFGNLTMVDTNSRGLQVVEEAYHDGDEDLLPLVRRRTHDIAFAEAGDRLMAEGEVGDMLLVVSPFLEEQDKATAKKLGDWTEVERGYTWLARKINDHQMEYTDISIDRSSVQTWNQTLASYGLTIPHGTKSHEYSGYIAKFTGIVSSEQHAAFVTDFKHTYQRFNRPNTPFAHEADDALESTAFLDKYAQGHIKLLVDTHEAVARTLETGTLDDFVRLSAHRALETLDCLDAGESRELYDLLKTEVIDEFRHGSALANIIKAQRYGIWKTVSKMVSGQTELVEYMGAPESSLAAVAYKLRMLNEIYSNTNEAAIQVETMPGCAGGTSFLSRSAEEIKKTTFSRENYSFNIKMHCVVCQPKPKPNEPPKMCGPCGICQGCDTKLRKHSAAQAKSAAWN